MSELHCLDSDIAVERLIDPRACCGVFGRWGREPWQRGGDPFLDTAWAFGGREDVGDRVKVPYTPWTISALEHADRIEGVFFMESFDSRYA